jgi:hypothetical protein
MRELERRQNREKERADKAEEAAANGIIIREAEEEVMEFPIVVADVNQVVSWRFWQVPKVGD